MVRTGWQCTWIRILTTTLTICAMAGLYAWGQYDLPAAGTETAGAIRTVSAVFMILIIALCWLALLASEDAAVFAYFQF